ncbi:hypothetical protein HPB51_004179 [Rhipicephalus microplus]|uniref:Uncharacterized protein n=1 Tax=Rhipicephalus microplus TaxID=6941 RepID=A0A9J6E6Q5_RHIMP|nr:hypothetical protein HPB51_004179 [Rhipicephalus microplus]
MKLTRLTHDAVPEIFPDSPGYLSDAYQSREEPGMKKKGKEDEQLQKAIEESMLAHKKELEENKLTCLDDKFSPAPATRKKVQSSVIAAADSAAPHWHVASKDITRLSGRKYKRQVTKQPSKRQSGGATLIILPGWMDRMDECADAEAEPASVTTPVPSPELQRKSRRNEQERSPELPAADGRSEFSPPAATEPPVATDEHSP